MKNKIYCLLITLLVGSSVFAYTYESYSTAPAIRRYPSNSNVTAIQSTNAFRSDTNSSYQNSAYGSAIDEIKNKIKQNPNDYVYYVSLIDLYLKSGQYEKSFEELIFLSNLSRQNKLDNTVKQSINNISQNYKTNLKYDRNRIPISLNLALMSLIVKDYTGAEDYIIMAAPYNTNREMLKNTIAIVFDTTQNTQKAVSICDRILAQNPSDSEIRKLKASYLSQTGNKQAATDEYSKVLDSQPKDSDAKYNLYKSLTAKNMQDKDIIKQLYKTDKPNYEKAYYELTEMLLKKGEIQDAKKYALLLTEKFPDNAYGYIFLSEIYKKEGKMQESYQTLEKVRDKADSNEAIAKYNVMLAKLSDQPVKEANSLIANGLYQQALEVLDSASQEDLYVILTQARANYLLKKKGNTFDYLNKAMSLYPENSDVYCAFGYIYLQEKDIDTARKYVDRSLKINPDNRTAHDLLDMVNQAETNKGMNNIISSYESQNYSEAMRLIDEALKINKKDPNIYLYKALTYIAQNNYAASTASLYKCIELDKNNKLAYFYLATAFDNLSEPQNALQNYQKYIELLNKDDFEESERKEYAMTRIKRLQQKN